MLLQPQLGVESLQTIQSSSIGDFLFFLYSRNLNFDLVFLHVAAHSFNNKPKDLWVMAVLV